MDVVLINDKLQWSLIPMIQSYDGIEITQYPMPAARLLQIMTFVLLISSISVDKNDIIPLSRQFDFSSVNLRKHERKAMCLLRSFNLELTSANFNGFSITFATFERIVGTNSSHGTMPNIFIPLHHFLRSILYDPSINNIDPYTNPEFKESRVLSNPMLAQLSTILPADFIFSRLRKLYIGSESGFSMRQMESKIFKWNAPTILFVSGSRIDPESPTSLRNKKFMTFKSEFPRFHTTSKTSQSIPQNDDDNKQQYTYMIFLSKPWKISNSECFGDDTSLIVQLSPRQIVYNANKSCISPNYAYFNTIGGGLGFGSKPPVVKNSVKVYRPGEVSLTVEANMEIGNFRHLNIPGTFCTGSVFQGDRNAPEFETTFQITDIEVWGCGSEKELEEQKKLWEWEHREAEARKRLNVMNWDDGKALLEMAGMIGGAGNSGGSV
ncbi:hypothetical protein CANARDRAFT_176359 [[Candida] arabinofermentans NRRL YB-2248]|uniref:TLDc domain-containing protein n=1 Tax=[Candida] arabinofermentans NRRL YB-2248 TaxID=983967 RepID=A0A1E4SZM2_9ASCO|nr:hypothetical protein CANARDRAFT_176359 [[Candida] arabinofermentans NRRL YB-2248]